MQAAVAQAPAGAQAHAGAPAPPTVKAAPQLAPKTVVGFSCD